MTVEFKPGQEVVVHLLMVHCNACGQQAQIPVADGELWTDAHFLPVVEAAFLQLPGGEPSWQSIILE